MKGRTMKLYKKIITLLIFIILTSGSLLAKPDSTNKESKKDDYGEWVKAVVEGMKDQEPMNMLTVLIPKWKNSKDEIIAEYKHLLENDTLDYYDPKTKELIKNDTERILHTNAAKRCRLLGNYYYFAKWPIQLHNDDKLRDLLIYAYENDPLLSVTNLSIKGLGYFALLGDNVALDFINSHLNDDLPESVKLKLHLANLLANNDKQSVEYLMNIISNAQNVATTDRAYGSPLEGIIGGGLMKIPGRRLFYELDYDYILPMVKELIYSRCKGVSQNAMLLYRTCTNSAEIEKLEKKLWKKVEDKNTPRDEYIDALCGLQAMLFLRNFRSNSTNIDYRKIQHYFASMVTIVAYNEKEGNIYENSKDFTDPRLNLEEKIYFSTRLRSQTTIPDTRNIRLKNLGLERLGVKNEKANNNDRIYSNTCKFI